MKRSIMRAACALLFIATTPTMASAAVDPVARAMSADALTILKSLTNNIAPIQVSQPTLSGTPIVGNILTASQGTFTGNPTETIQWLRNGVNITGATAFSYTLVTADSGQNVGFDIVATNAYGSLSNLSPTFVVNAATSFSPSLDFSDARNSQYIL